MKYIIMIVTLMIAGCATTQSKVNNKLGACAPIYDDKDKWVLVCETQYTFGQVLPGAATWLTKHPPEAKATQPAAKPVAKK